MVNCFFLKTDCKRGAL